MQTAVEVPQRPAGGLGDGEGGEDGDDAGAEDIEGRADGVAGALEQAKLDQGERYPEDREGRQRPARGSSEGKNCWAITVAK